MSQLANVSTILPPQQREIPPYVYYERLFSQPECEALIRLGESASLYPGQIGNGIANQHVTDENYRKVLTRAIMPDEAPWAYERILSRVAACNAEHFRYDLHGLHEHLVFLRYDFIEGQEPGHYDWHQDTGGGMSSLRKLSTVTQLSEPDDYLGCRLRLFTNRDFDPGHVGRGDTVVFPSWTPHCVTPIERGTRYSLVSWVTGPQYR
jgi:PKHD-type hydroxylase